MFTLKKQSASYWALEEEGGISIRTPWTHVILQEARLDEQRVGGSTEKPSLFHPEPVQLIKAAILHMRSVSLGNPGWKDFHAYSACLIVFYHNRPADLDK